MRAIQSRAGKFEPSFAVASEAASELDAWKQIMSRLTGDRYAVALWFEVDRREAEAQDESHADAWLAQFVDYLNPSDEVAAQPAAPEEAGIDEAELRAQDGARSEEARTDDAMS